MEPVIRLSAHRLAAERADSADEDVHFPQALVRTVVEEFTDVGDTVLDPFVGYGTTLVVCEQLKRLAVGVELLPERVAAAHGRLTGNARVVEGDARRLDELVVGPVDLCVTSPPYMNAADHPQNPLTAYQTVDGHYSTYLSELTAIFVAVTRLLRPGGHLVINAANIRTGDSVTPLAWDIQHALTPYLTFQGETYLLWDEPPPSLSGDYCLVFCKN